MDRRVGLRARTEFSVVALNGWLKAPCRALEVSPTGMIVDRGRPVEQGAGPSLLGLELSLPERVRTIKAMVRPVWSMGTQQAYRFVKMNDADRLTLAEHMDVLRHRGVPMS